MYGVFVLRKIVVATLVALLSAVGLTAGTGLAAAAVGDIGYEGRSFSGLSAPPTADKPQSKLWHTPDGLWWSVMFEEGSRTWRIFRLDRSTQQWVDTGVLVDERDNSSADTLWDGTKLYVASHSVTESTATKSKVSLVDRPAQLTRYSYSAATTTFTRDAGFPVAINNHSSESLTIDKDSTGVLWATWTQVGGDATAGYTSTVYVNSTTGSDASWGTPFTPAVPGVNPHPDDVSAVVAFGQNKVGILWSNQLDGAVYWAVHNDGSGRTDWRGSEAIRGTHMADDHLNIKSVQSDQAGRVFAVVKTELDHLATKKSSDPQILLLVFKPGTGSWSQTTVGTIADCHSRPQLVLDETSQQVHVVAPAPSDPGCESTGAVGTVYLKSAPMDNPLFAAGRGTPIIRDAESTGMNNPTTTKQTITAKSGLVVLASDMSTSRYWHSDSLGSITPTAPATGDRLSAGQQLAAGQQLTSPNGKYTLVMQTDGNIVVYASGSRVLWQSATNGRPGARLVLQGDGNLVAYGADNKAVWHTDTWGASGGRLVLQDDGNAVLYTAGGTPMWFTGWDRGAGVPIDSMYPLQQLTAGQQLLSANGSHRLVMQGDGNVVVYGPGLRPVWFTGTRVAGSRLILQGDGNVIARTPSRQVAWHAGTWGNPGTRLVVQNDGNLVLYAANGRPLWSALYGRTY